MMQRKMKSIGCRLFAGFLAVIMLVTCIGEVSYAAEIMDNGSLETVQEISEQEQSLDLEVENTDSQNVVENSTQTEENIVSEEEISVESSVEETTSEDSILEENMSEETTSEDGVSEETIFEENSEFEGMISESEETETVQEADEENDAVEDEVMSNPADLESPEQEITETVSEKVNIYDTGTTVEQAEAVEEQAIEATEDLTDVVLQAGGLLDEEVALPPVVFYGTNLVEEVGASLTAAFDSFATECNLVEYQITGEELKVIFTEVLNTNPRYFYVYGGYEYSYSGTTGYVTRVRITYLYDQSTTAAMLKEYDNAVAKAVKGAVNTWSDMEKALYINDYLTRNCQYDLTYTNYDAYDVFVSKTAVCQGYALAYMELAEELELECEVVTSTSLNHAWNLISVNGNFYNVDATWNDPTSDLLGRSRHFYFMKSTEQYNSEEAGHCKEEDWVVTGGRAAADASDMSYDAYFWNAIDCGFEYLNGYWYNFDGNSEIAKYSCDGFNFIKSAKVQDVTDVWYTVDLTGYYGGKYVGTGSYNGEFYYSTDDAIYTWNPTGSVSTKIFELSAEQKKTGYIYGMHVDSTGDISYLLAPDPNGSGSIYTIENSNVSTTMDVCYVSQNGNDNNAGSESSPVETIYKALELINEGGIIYVCDNLVVNDNLGNDAPLIIEKAVTIQAKDNSLPTIDLRAGGIILGADVTFKNVKIGTGSYLRPGIAANGHKLDLVNVQEASSLRPLQIYGGTFIDYVTKEDFGSESRGSASEITIVGGEYDGIYAGSANGSINLPVTINVSKGNSLTLGGIYVGSTIKNPSDSSMAGSIPVLDSSIMLPAAVNISVSDNAYVTVVDGVSEANTVNFVTDGIGAYSFSVKYLDNIKVCGGTFTPAYGSILGNDGSNVPNVILEGSAENKATFDVSECISNSGMISLNNFTGTENSIFVLNKDHTLKLAGTLSGNNIEFRLSGGMPWSSEENPGYSGVMEYNKTYITGGSGNGTFVISNPNESQIDMAFTNTSSVANGWTTVESSEYELPKLIDFSISSKNVTFDEMNTDNGVVIDVLATYAEDEWCPYLSWLPLKYKITYTDISGNVKEYIQQSSVEDSSGNYYCDYTSSTSSAVSSEILMKLEPISNDDNTTIRIVKMDTNIEAGTYRIEVTAPTMSGDITRTFDLKVIAEDSNPDGDDTGDNGGNDDGDDNENPPEVVEPEEIIYSITYNGNGATGGITLPQTGLKNENTYNLRTNGYIRVDYTFVGWNTKADGSGESYENGASVKNLATVNGETIVLYAQWKPITYSLTYNLNGGTNNSANPASYTRTTATITLKNPSRTGYTFGGWYSDSKYTKQVKTINKGSIGNKTLYAKWTPNKYNIAFKGNSSNSGSMANVSGCKYGSSYTLKANTFKRNGYTFAGWNTKANGTGTTYKNKASVKNLTSSNGKTVTLYAQWKAVNYSIKYNLNGGKNHSKNPASYTVATANIKLQNPTKTGYKFKGWYSDSKCTKKVTTIAKGSTGNKTLYAKWEAVKYTIKYSLNGGKNHSKNPTSYTVATANIRLQNPTRTGYKFKGWYSDSKCTKRVTTIAKGSTGNKTLYAKWEAVKYSVTYKLNGGKNNSKNPTSYTVATANIKLQNPSRAGYKFKGWYSDSKCTKRVTTIAKGSTGNKILYAKWSKK